MDLQMYLVDDGSAQSASDRQYGDPVWTGDALAATECDQERLIALLQCAYSWSRPQAQQEVMKWLAMEAGEAAPAQYDVSS